ncbi:[LSU ribosomal protein L11P]-lysine N-methyltransferase [Rubellimicrobium thermophilum DSM 16684]|uniref:Ribosomal protein L11 methyltransferase n=1 Tax=Rubellimicrobium thermophilum DSM 16684 TaxID=1123069 RepID=S9S6P8_9RHOB|nr:50S ribosomal protein L11 methyltransferase [Rubellimicrobium thermophilum]EPX85875.1 [LSU ribosomal protein L11P]-lysine N-methyltransferase [Rubellimicrobium thermophilum DSM 16684]
MTIYAAMTTLAGREAAEALAEAVERLDPPPFAVGHFEIEDGSGLFEVSVHFEQAPDIAALALLALVHGARDWTVSEVPDVDWVAKVRRDLPPVEAGRFFLHGAHDADKVPPGRVALLIEAAMAFGTGHHPTTVGCLLALDRLEGAGFVPRTVADIGAGTAVLAMAAARLWPQAQVTAGDIDPVAVETATANCAANALPHIRCVEAAGLDHPALAGPFDLILANILKAPLIGIAPDVAAACAPGARVILSGILRDQATEVAAAYARFGINEATREEIGDWTTLVLTA